ncbi:MAG: DUF1799 domain-containing protein [Proteobacteria bacterium]|nr:DUF1799 domain-containing protein [Pseudomonadota bacterium]
MDAAWSAECASLGIDPQRLLPQGAQALDAAPDHELWHEHGAAWGVFVACRTQWRVITNAMTGQRWFDGLHYPAVETVMRLQGVAARRRGEVFAQLQVLEDEFLRIANAD